MDNTLRVAPAALTDGARQFRETHDALRSLLSGIHDRQGALQGKWTGGAATRGNTTWSDLHDALGAHIDLLAEHADTLHTAAGCYRDRDDEQGANIDRQM